MTVKPKGLSDAIDGSNSFPGAMTKLANMVPDPGTGSVFIPRSASILLTDFGSSGITTPGNISAELVVGTRVYGMIGSSSPAGHDVPYCYDFSTNSFVAIADITSANTPVTQSASGDWTPPHMEMIANRVICTHPGFPGGTGAYFGWLDLTGFSSTTLVGNTTNGSKVIQSISGDGTSSPILDGVQPGQTVTGTGIPANTVVESVSNGTVDINTTGTTHSNTTIDAIPASAVALMQIGMYVSGSGIVPGTFIQALPGGGVSITLSQGATASASGVAINVSGGGTITLSNAATATNALVALAITGGTFAAPVWSAGNTNVNPLPAVPAWVSQFNGRAYYAVNNGEYFSDSLAPLNISLGTQALTFGDNTPVTCSAGLPLNNITTGGIIQALIVVKGAEVMWQITGDQGTNDLASNALNVSVGSLAPNTFTPTPLGLAFIAPDGLRVVDFTAHISDPIGANGEGVQAPFLNALFPTRMCAAFNQNVLRVTVQNAGATGDPYQEYWWDFTRKIWTGPHSFGNALIQPAFALAAKGKGFIGVGAGISSKLWQSDAIPTASDSYVENGALLNWSYQTVLLPDNQDMSQNRLGESAIALSLPPGQVVGVTFTNEIGTILNQVQINSTSSGAAVWGGFNWGSAAWSAGGGTFWQYNIPWTGPVIFKQGQVQFAGASQSGFAIGNLYLRYQPLGYLLNVLGAA
jgi:hypothetical protein